MPITLARLGFVDEFNYLDLIKYNDQLNEPDIKRRTINAS
jgi:hypothetical protein